jgi:hypothetical protein
MNGRLAQVCPSINLGGPLLDFEMWGTTNPKSPLFVL